MDFLNRAFSQLTDLFRSMTPGARITAGLLLAVVVVSLAYLFRWQMSGPDVDLMNGVPVSADDLPAMESAFHAATLNDYQVRGTQILVPGGKKAAYMAALADAQALPANIDKVFDDALKGSSVFMPRQQREDMMKIAKQKVLAMTIGAMKGIERAYVLYDTKTNNGFPRTTETTATASVKAEGSRQLDDQQVSAIRHLVSGAIAGLEPEDVTVADLSGPIHHGGSAKNGGSATDNLFAALTRSYEQEWKTKVLNALTYVPGVTVEAYVMLDREQLNNTMSITHDPKTTPTLEISEDTSKTVEGSGSAGRPGYASQQPNTGAALLGPGSAGSKESETEEKRQVVSVTNTEQQETQKVGMTPQQVSVSIGIPVSYFEEIWKRLNPPAEGQEPRTPDQNDLQRIQEEATTKIRTHVANLLPTPAAGTDRTQLVEVNTFQDLKPAEIPGPGIGENVLGWLGQYWATLGMIGLAGFSLVMLRSMVKAAPAGSQAAATSGAADDDEEEGEEKAAINRLGRFTGSGHSLRDDLSELVQEDPDTAANILRTWIGNAG
ncbi:MAG TPA: hypothetical protein VMY42_10030 [Thermoguttaceae bacterium]|nr:hypothetical protein [Thermoguttaceae bacterium]